MSPSIAILSTRRLEKSASSTNCFPRTRLVPVVAATVRQTVYKAHKRPSPPDQMPLPRSIAAISSPAPETAPAVPAAPPLLPTSLGLAAVTLAPAPAAAFGRNCTPACAPKLLALARGPVAVRCIAGRSFHRGVPWDSQAMPCRD